MLIKSNHLYQFLLIFLACLYSCVGFTQNLKSANQYYKQKKYFEASEIYKTSWNIVEKDPDLLLQAGISCYESNALDYSIRCFEKLLSRSNKYSKLGAWYLAKSYQHQNQFELAIFQYKNYLKATDRDDPQKAFIKNELLRCAMGLKYNRQTPIAIVEPISGGINTIQDEYAVVPLPNSNIFYLNAIRDENEGGLRNELGYLDSENGFLRSDIFQIEKLNGGWTTPTKIQKQINSSMHDHVLEIIENEKILLFFRTLNDEKGSLLLDTLDNPFINFTQASFNSPMIADIGDHGVSIFQDTLMIFSSCRLGGYGAYDLYISVKRNEHWMEPINLGPTINTVFNEDYPYITKDGRTLYFSSDNLLSIGGYDIFKTKFWPEANQWGSPINLGIPINSAGNDTHFRLTPDGLAGIFTSDRKTDNKGGKDIFMAYFKEDLEEQLTLENGSPLSNLMDESNDADRLLINTNSNTGYKTKETKEFKEYYIESIYYKDDDFLKESKNKKLLEQYILILQMHPALRIEIAGHAFEDSQDPINLYYSIKKAEVIEKYLIENQIAPNRIHCYGLGSSFPIAKRTINGNKSAVSEKLNKRIDFFFENSDSSLLNINYSSIPIPESLRQEKESSFRTSRLGIRYSLYLGSSSSILNHPLIQDSETPYFMEKKQTGYQYYAGVYKRFTEAEAALKQAILQFGIKAEIKAFRNGVPLNRADIIDFVLQDSDLLLYLNYLKSQNN